MNTCGSHTAAYQTIGGGSIAGQAVITAGYPVQGGGGRKSKRRSTKRRSARRSVRRSARRSTRRVVRRSHKHSRKHSIRKPVTKHKNFVYSHLSKLK